MERIMWAAWRRWEMLKAREEGQDLAEYGLILALIAVVAIGALTLLGRNISAVLSSIASRIRS